MLNNTIKSPCDIGRTVGAARGGGEVGSEYLGIDELEDLKGHITELLIDGADHSIYGALHAVDSGFQRPRVVLGEFVQPRQANHRLQHRHVHEAQVLQSLRLPALKPPTQEEHHENPRQIPNPTADQTLNTKEEQQGGTCLRSLRFGLGFQPSSP